MDVNMALDEYFERNDSIIRAGGSKRREGHIMLAANAVVGVYLESLTTREVTFEFGRYTVKKLEFATDEELCDWLVKQIESDLTAAACRAYTEKSAAIRESECNLSEVRISVNPIGVRWLYYNQDSVGGGQWVHSWVTTAQFFETVEQVLSDFKIKISDGIQDWEAEEFENELTQKARTQLIDIADESYADALEDYKHHFDYVDFEPANIRAIAQKLEALQK